MRSRWLRHVVVAVGILFAGAAPLAADVARIDRYAETVMLDARGQGTLSIRLELPPSFEGRLVLRVPIGRPRGDVSVHPTDIVAAVSAVGPQPFIVATVSEPSDAPRVIDLALALDGVLDFERPALAHGARRLSYGASNVSGVEIGEFTGRLVLPPAVSVAGIDSVVPPVAESATNLPYEFVRHEERQAIVVTRASMTPGDNVLVTFRVKPKPSAVPYVALALVLSVMYLVSFRGLVFGSRAVTNDSTPGST